MNAEDVIVAPASPPGESDRAIVRLSGARLDEVLSGVEIASLSSPPEDHKPIALASSMALAPGLRLPLLLIRSFAPHSYTGEDSAELLLPGNPGLIARVLARLCAAPGARLAEPGEFTARAFLNGRISAEQAEGVALAIAARTEEQLSAAHSLLSGEAGARFRRWMDEAATLLALVEAGIDFTDQEDVQAIAPESLGRRLRALSEAIEREIGAEAPREAGVDTIRAVLVGEPNAGKSALFDALLGRSRAVVSPVHGATRDAIEEPLPPAPPSTR